MNYWTSVCRCLGRLESRDLEPQVGERVLALTRELEVRWDCLGKHLSWNGQAFAVDEVGWGSAYVGFDGSSDREESHRKLPKPPFRLVGAKGDERLLEPPMKPLHEAIGFGVIWGRHDCLYPPCPGELLEYGRRKLAPAVRRHCGRNSEVLYPAGYECVDDSLR